MSAFCHPPFLDLLDTLSHDCLVSSQMWCFGRLLPLMIGEKYRRTMSIALDEMINFSFMERWGNVAYYLSISVYLCKNRPCFQSFNGYLIARNLSFRPVLAQFSAVVVHYGLSICTYIIPRLHWIFEGPHKGTSWGFCGTLCHMQCNSQDTLHDSLSWNYWKVLINRILLLYFVVQLFGRFGPLVHLWCLRFEGKHNYFKDFAHQVKCFKNIAKTMAQNHQEYLCYKLNNYMHYRSPFDVKTTVGPGKLEWKLFITLHCTLLCMIATLIMTEIPKLQCKFWIAKMSR